jgi:hypothetical protein
MIDCSNGNIFMLLSLQQNNLFKVREEKYQSRIRVLEALASGTGEERGVWKTYLRLDWYKPFQNTPVFLILIFFQVVMDQLQQIKVCFRDKKKQFLSYLHHNLLSELLVFVTLSGIILLLSSHILLIVVPYVLHTISGGFVCPDKCQSLLRSSLLADSFELLARLHKYILIVVCFSFSFISSG